jgi:aerobic-type carbon monoxide dehydrogenase small subunit (CoxS/CutS family)
VKSEASRFEDSIAISLRVNGGDHAPSIHPRVTLLDALREHRGLTGTKKGCNFGECGARTMHLDGRRVGELDATGWAAAVANAVFHATGRRIRELPITPEKLVSFR